MTGADPAGPATATDDDAAELVAQLRALAGADPTEVRQVVAEVLAALDRAAGGALREHLPETIRVDAGLEAPSRI
ncbi:hypothetical protein ACWD6L_21610 [Micromonospora profundi]|uniref:Uncharacterized protein n=1 Tax=Micromonospora profundi TaxID=1420889 RepID=A0AAJ6L3U0_9ACTN|nr:MULTISPECIES: hypothetical protein [Micromonospora]KOX14958.1 hypothetical protein ADK66_02800 [Micromonospora sp. NRRL B-16802]NJC15154.1 hypothetical protein [Micromonospora profundi]WLS46676.1 hypothetical protein Q3V37_05235 [Micromonospora profundi]